jgi:hypothetical protein
MNESGRVDGRHDGSGLWQRHRPGLEPGDREM